MRIDGDEREDASPVSLAVSMQKNTRRPACSPLIVTQSHAEDSPTYLSKPHYGGGGSGEIRGRFPSEVARVDAREAGGV